MSDDTNTEGTTWPMPKFRFAVDFGNEMTGVSFQEVSGLETESQELEYRHGGGPAFSTVNMPVIAKMSNVIMKKGIFQTSKEFWEWYSEIKMNTLKRRTVIIKLLDENGGVVMRWTLNNAWPTKISSTDLKSDGNEVAIDSLEIAHEGMVIANG
jgi:phage tail-like protein